MFVRAFTDGDFNFTCALCNKYFVMCVPYIEKNEDYCFDCYDIIFSDEYRDSIAK